MKHKILVVDDEAEIRKTIGLQLEGTIYQVLLAEDGEKAIQVLDNDGHKDGQIPMHRAGDNYDLQKKKGKILCYQVMLKVRNSK